MQAHEYVLWAIHNYKPEYALKIVKREPLTEAGTSQQDQLLSSAIGDSWFGFQSFVPGDVAQQMQRDMQQPTGLASG